jgi:hypothetical protein
MKKLNNLAITLLVAATISVTSQAATILTSLTAPTPDAADIHNLVTPFTASDILNGDRAAAGQTFLTLGDAVGYELFALTFLQTRSTSTSGGTFNLRLGTVSGATFTEIATDTVTVESDALSLGGSGADYITFTLTSSIALDPNTLYGIDLVRTGSGNYINWGENANTNYNGGQSYTSGPNGLGSATLNLANNDRIFLLDMTSIPEPTTTALLGLGGLALILRRRK